MASGDSYYWAGGEKVPLLSCDQVVIDLDSEAAEAARPAVEALGRQGRQLLRSLVMVPKAAAQELLGSSSAAVHPVFRTEDGTLLAVLPEVRVEASPGRLDEVGRSLSGAHVTERSDERLVLVPDSHRGEDALRIANELSEHGGVEVSQARFVRVFARPGP